MSLTAVALTLLLLAGLDGTFAGFRGSVGRDGRIRHRSDDVRYGGHGLVWVMVLLTPAASLVLMDLREDGRAEVWRSAGTRMLSVYAPYAAIGLIGIVVYLVLGWRRRFLANALVLGPFTLVRPLVVVAGALLAGMSADDPRVWSVLLWCVAATLLVGPLVGLRWRARQPGQSVGV